ncbi:methylated-DNA--[protein]-cysteine S-methyltransferase [Marinirhabdus gelatinilytica]|uniref:Methylated-DNA--protein-cysteine methyltransferase n=1 Tax=Marinirhabdus gelatinilytica TaxID=1703343 RepID=A0A370QJP4_9FLAO|nr:methylated-DNA--[protein]-cysteine S-methyltransferase [Marinirhabdus gelatinilytica]RDK88585.1 methylated-DNA-[protein]-cysteine S-methyltransferase [Marinirhabdus gelatinilytica]
MVNISINTPLGPLFIEGSRDGISSISFVDTPISETIEVPPVLQQAVIQLNEYFNKQRREFSLQLAPKGTVFQQKVWKKLQDIPYGKTTSYQEMANQLGDPKVIRAAASANGKNPIAIVVPCHRVIGSDGSLTGYAGGLHRKKWLLEHESPIKQGKLF